MIEVWFESLLHRSLTGTYCILIVLAVRFFLNKVSRKYAYYLWMIVFVNLVFTISARSPFSLIPKQLVLSPEAVNEETIRLPEAVENPETMIPVTPENGMEFKQSLPVIQEEAEHPASLGVNSRTRVTVTLLAVCIWILGVVVFVLYSMVSAVRLNLRIRRSFVICLDKKRRIMEFNDISTPFLWGILYPTIYLPADMEEQERTYIIAHEECHRRRYDHLVKMFFYGVTVIHWFNPLVWLAYSLGCKDMEISCDEMVLERLGKSIRKAYAESLLKYAARQNGYVITPLTFGEPSVRSRIEYVLHYRKKSILVSILAVVVTVFVAVGLLMRSESVVPSATDQGTTEKESLAEEEENHKQQANHKEDILQEEVLVDDEYFYLYDPVPGVPCVNLSESGWSLDQWIDLRKRFPDLVYMFEEDTLEDTFLLKDTEHYTLYGSGDYERMLLEYEGQYAEIRYPYTSNYMIPVDMVESDFDGDGTPELAMKLNIKHGTGIYIDTFFMADLVDDGLYVYQFLENDIIAQFDKHLSYVRTEHGLQALVDGENAGTVLEDIPGQKPYDRVSIGNQIRFYLGDERVHVSALLEFYTDDTQDFVFDCNDYDVRALVSYQDGGEFVLTEYESRNTAVEAVARAAAEDFYTGDFRIVDIRYDVHDTGGHATVVILPQDMDSYDYLDMELEDDWGNWIVENLYLEK